MKKYLIEWEGFELVTSYNDLNVNLSKNLTTRFRFNRFQNFRSERYANINLVCTGEDLVSLENLDELTFGNNLFVFLSRHSSKSKMPALTSHFTGNFSSDNSLGGRPYEIGCAYPTFQKEYMKNLHAMKYALLKYDLTIEASHHGPTTSIDPIMFVEIGSTEEEWNNIETSALVCKCLLRTINNLSQSEKRKDRKIAIGLGGNHYSQKFNNLINTSNVAFASIASKYNLRFINEKLLEQMKRKSIEKINCIYIDENGLGSEKRRLLNILESQELQTNFI